MKSICVLFNIHDPKKIYSNRKCKTKVISPFNC